MKLSKILGLIILGLVFIGILFFSSKNFFFQTQDKVVISIPVDLKEAKKLFLEGIKAHDDNLKQQAKDKYSIWLKKNINSSNKKLIADVLRSKASVSEDLNEWDEAINDLKKSVQYDPVGEVQFGICLFEKKRGNLTALHDCYVKAVNIFTKKKNSKKSLNFLLARVLSGDQLAIADYKYLLSVSTEDQRSAYKAIAKEYFDKEIYDEIIK